MPSAFLPCATIAFGLALLVSPLAAHSNEVQIEVVEYYGYDDCILMKNESTRVVLCPAAGGRVLEYSYEGINALYLPDGNEGWRWEPGKGGGAMHAGRFDIGPEQTIAAHPVLWKGPWQGLIVDGTTARLTSEVDEATGVRLVREFVLDGKTSRLHCKQTIENVSDVTVEYCHWSRTFAVGGGICLVPISQPSKFPFGFVMYENGSLINSKPEDPNIREREGFIEILAAPRVPKLGMDSMEGWLGYAMPNDLLFVKTFPTFPDRVYNEVAGLTISIWYPDGPMCELEPIGPRERIAPGNSASFTETWHLMPLEFPEQGESLNLDDVRSIVQETDSRQR